MYNLKKLIEKNLYLRVDFDKRYKKTEQGVAEVAKFFLIGVLPVMIFYQDEEREKASLNYSLIVPRDPFLRLLQGVKATDHKRLGSYKKKVKDIVRRLEGGFLKVLKDGKFNNKEFQKILIINFDQKNAGSTNNKISGDQTLRQECQKASNQAD